MKLDAQRKASALWHGSVALVRTALGHSILQLAAALTYYTLLSIFPALIVVVSLLGLLGLPPETLESILNGVAEKTQSQWAIDTVSDVLDSVFQSASASAFLSIGVLTALYSSSAYVRSFMWSSDLIYGVTTSRSYWRGLPIRIGLALMLILLFTLGVAALTFLGPFRNWAISNLGLDPSVVDPWLWLASLLLLGIAVLMLGLLFKYAPSRRQPALWRLLIGASMTAVSLVLATVGYGIYFVSFSSYNTLYGALGAALGFIVWAWVMNIAVLAGVEINRAIEFRGTGDAADAADEDGAADGLGAAGGDGGAD